MEIKLLAAQASLISRCRFYLAYEAGTLGQKNEEQFSARTQAEDHGEKNKNVLLIQRS
jgi:hypothetical protein